jgi:hypothetical protein
MVGFFGTDQAHNAPNIPVEMDTLTKWYALTVTGMSGFAKAIRRPDRRTERNVA